MAARIQDGAVEIFHININININHLRMTYEHMSMRSRE